MSRSKGFKHTEETKANMRHPHRKCAKQSIEKRFWLHVGPHDDPTKCWLWLASSGSHGYGQFSIRHGITVLVHRFSYEMKYGPIPPRMTIDHVRSRGCMNILCVNPEHLEAVTNKVNILRGNGWSGLNSRKTHCKRGHLFDEVNTYKYKSGRWCRICKRGANNE